MKTIKVNICGNQRVAWLGSWEEIKKHGIRKDERMFGALNDGTPALFFMGEYLHTKQGYMWYVTTEKLEDIHD
jgi:hypothetical protein